MSATEALTIMHPILFAVAMPARLALLRQMSYNKRGTHWCHYVLSLRRQESYPPMTARIQQSKTNIQEMGYPPIEVESYDSNDARTGSRVTFGVIRTKKAYEEWGTPVHPKVNIFFTRRGGSPIEPMESVQPVVISWARWRHYR
jgi:hypothetical protein